MLGQFGSKYSQTMFKVSALLLCLVGLACCGPSRWDNVFEKCKAADSACLNKAIEGAVKKIGPGIPSLNVPALDPAFIKEMKIGAGASAVHLDQNYHNMKIYGLGNPVINQSNFDLDKKILTFTSLYPKLEQKADYEVNGKILIAPVFGKGDSSIIIENVAIDHQLHFEELDKAGEKFLNVDTYKAKIAIGHATFYFGNLFNGNKELGDNINKLINDEWEAIYSDVKSGYELAYSAVFKQYADKVFSKIPVKMLFT